MSSEIKILWLEDDAPEYRPFQYNGHTVLVASNCERAKQYLDDYPEIRMAVVDLLVPQSGWRSEEIFVDPGLEFIHEELVERSGMVAVVFSANMPDVVQKRLGEIRVPAFDKLEQRLGSVLDHLIKIKDSEVAIGETPDSTA